MDLALDKAKFVVMKTNLRAEGAISRKRGHAKHTKDYWVTHIASSNLHQMSRLKTKQ